jgi:hypothetical protein
MAITKIPAAGFTGNNFRNIIINGDMSIAQRGTSATGLGNGDNGYHTVDRWTFLESGTTTYEFTMSQDTDVPSGQGFATSLKLDCTTADASLDADNLIRIAQIIESQNLQYLKYGTSNAESLTASFWVKSTVTGDYNVNLYNYGSGGGARIISSIYTINSADTWEKKTITFDGDTVEAFLNDNTAGLNLAFSLGSGTSYTSTDATSWGSYSSGKLAYGQVANIASSTANNFYITGIQLEAGTSASDFEFLPYDMNLRRCERYYQLFNYKSGSAICIGNSNTSTTAAGAFDFNTMRTAPTVTLPTAGQTNNTASYLASNGAYPTTTGTFTAESINIKNFRLKGNSYSGLNSGGVSWCYSSGNTSIKLDSEL